MPHCPILRRCRARLLAFPLAALGSGAMAQPVDFSSATYVNEGMVSVGRMPAQTRDLLGDTLMFGSGLVMDLTR